MAAGAILPPLFFERCLEEPIDLSRFGLSFLPHAWRSQERS